MAQDWYVIAGGQQVGPISAQQMRDMAASGQLQPTDTVWKEGMPNWVPAKSVKGLPFASGGAGGALQPQAPIRQPVAQEEYQPRETGPSRHFRFDGQAGDFFVTALLAALLMMVTCYIATPWSVCMIQRWISEHTLIQGRRLKFMGTGGDLFVKFIIWYLLTLVTFGIYVFWMVPKMQKWIIENTDFADA